MEKKNKKYYLFQMKMLPLNIVSIILFVLMICITYFVDREFLSSSFVTVYDSFGLLLIFMIIFMVIHELLHSIAYVIYGGSFKKIVYGVYLEKGVFYCLCKQNINKLNILNSLFFPLFYIGVVTYILGMAFELPFITWLSIFNITGCSGDIIMFMFMSKLNKNIEFTEVDDPTSFAIYSDEDVSKNNHFGLKYIGCYDKVDRDYLKKVTVSKFSWIFLILILVLSIVAFIIQ